MKALADNDILFKGACYWLLNELVSVVCAEGEVIGVLGAARFIVPKKIHRANLKRSTDQALEVFSAFLTRSEQLEPSLGEQELAAEFELLAQTLHVGLDSGESQLCAVLVSRAAGELLSGDKRAVEAIESILDRHEKLSIICGKVRCLEQLVASAFLHVRGIDIRDAICAEPGIDKALTICFSCGNPIVGASNFILGLQSYIEHLRRRAARVLAP